MSKQNKQNYCFSLLEEVPQPTFHHLPVGPAFLKNIYMSFGIDDFVSKHNTNAFFGIGVRFVDDDIKYIIGKIGLFSGTGLFTS